MMQNYYKRNLNFYISTIYTQSLKLIFLPSNVKNGCFVEYSNVNIMQ